MKTKTVVATETRTAKAWYVRYPLDAHAQGPFRYEEKGFVGADTAVNDGKRMFGAFPVEVWPSGETREVPEYEYSLDVPTEE